MNVSPPAGPEQAEPGKEAVITIAYINKGKSEAANLSATLTGDIKALSKVQNIGNIESGRSGTIEFIVTPEKSGVAQFTIDVSYEDASGQAIKQSFPVNLAVAELEEPAGEELPEGLEVHGEGEMSGTGENGSLLYYGLGGLAILGGAAAMGIRRRRSRKRKQDEMLFRLEDIPVEGEGPHEKA